MQLRLLDAKRDLDYIRHAKGIVAGEMGAKSTGGQGLDPLNYAMYLSVFSGDETRPIGMTESYFINRVYPALEGCPLAAISDLNAHVDFSSIAVMQTIYVEPGIRARAPAYLYLSLGTAIVMQRRGAKIGIAATAASSASLLRLYQKSGGRHVATLPFADDPSDPTAILVFDIAQALTHPRVQCVARALPSDLANTHGNREISRSP